MEALDATEVLDLAGRAVYPSLAGAPEKVVLVRLGTLVLITIFVSAIQVPFNLIWEQEAHTCWLHTHRLGSLERAGLLFCRRKSRYWLVHGYGRLQNVFGQ